MRSVIITILSFVLASPALAGDRLVVHEWGTFTSLQDEQGRPIGGINTDDEAVPDFVHQPIRALYIKSPVPPAFSQGAPLAHPHVTMRLETPVLYFHLPRDGPDTMKLNVKVSFRRGWMTEFYPNADSRITGTTLSTQASINERTESHLEWKSLTVGGAGAGPNTQEKVWLAPRKVDAANVTTEKGQSERFIFYRGVANLDAPLVVKRHRGTRDADDRLILEGRLDPAIEKDHLVVPQIWLADIRTDGTVAYRTLGPVKLLSERHKMRLMVRNVSSIRASFDPQDYDGANLSKLRKSMHEALVKDGLFADEADALLNTWEVSYFKSPGTRLFFIVPRAWTDHVLPLEISAPADVTRVMVGRIELVTPESRAALQRLTEAPPSDPAWLGKAERAEPEIFKKVSAGRLPISALTAKPPADFRAYDDLGRFRFAIVLDELKHRPGKALKSFAKRYKLRPHVIRAE